MVRQRWLVLTQGLVGTSQWPSAVPGPAGALSLLTLHQGQEPCPLGLSVGDLHHPKIWVSPLPRYCRNTPQYHQRAEDTGGPHLVAPPDSPIQCHSHPTPSSCPCCLQKPGPHPDGGAQGSQVGKKAETQVKGNSSPCAVAGGLLSLFHRPRGRSLAIPSLQQTQPPGQPGRDGETFPPPGRDGEGPRGFLFNAML